MNSLPFRLLLTCLVIIAMTSVAAAQSVQVRLADGTTWRGQISDHIEVTYLQQGIERKLVGKLVEAGDLYIMVEGDMAGASRRTTIFKGDVRAISNVEKEQPARSPRRATPGQRQDEQRDPAKDADSPGVIVLPLTGMVGPRIRADLIEDVGRYADRYGPGQMIVLEITTGGGAVIEMEQIARVMQDVRERHRLIAWVHEAISAGCATAMLCHEIYFSTMGTAGSMTAFAGGTSWQGDQLRMWLDQAGEWMESGGRHRYIAHAMIHAPLMLSYDKDSRTGEITFYNDLSGDYILSRQGENLTLNASNAVHCGFADGIADTKEDLAKLLDMPRWRELSDYGRRLHRDWNALVDRAEREVPRLHARRQIQTAGDALENLGRQIRLVSELLAWWERAPGAMYYITGPASKEHWERELIELRKQMADLQRQQRGGRR